MSGRGEEWEVWCFTPGDGGSWSSRRAGYSNVEEAQASAEGRVRSGESNTRDLYVDRGDVTPTSLRQGRGRELGNWNCLNGGEAGEGRNGSEILFPPTSISYLCLRGLSSNRSRNVMHVVTACIDTTFPFPLYVCASVLLKRSCRLVNGRIRCRRFQCQTASTPQISSVAPPPAQCSQGAEADSLV